MLYRALIFRFVLGATLSLPVPLVFDEARADENLWGYLYGADTLPKGGTEIYNQRAVEIFTDNLRRCLAGEPLRNVVDPARGY